MKRIFFIVFLALISNSAVVGQAADDSELESPLSNGLKGINRVSVYVHSTYFFQIVINGDAQKLQDMLYYQLKNAGVQTDSNQEIEAQLWVQIHGTPIGDQEIIGYAYSVELSLNQDVFLARKKNQFLVSRETWSRTYTSYTSLSGIESAIQNNVKQLMDEFLIDYLKVN